MPFIQKGLEAELSSTVCWTQQKCVAIYQKFSMLGFLDPYLRQSTLDERGSPHIQSLQNINREKMVAVLLSAGAKPNLVTDPTSKNPGGCTAGDLASMNGYDGLITQFRKGFDNSVRGDGRCWKC